MAVSSRFTDPGILKTPLMLLGMAGLTLFYLKRLRPSSVLILFLVFWMYGYFRLTRTGNFHEAAVMQVGILCAFLLGYLRAPLAHRHMMPLLILLCVIRGLIDIVTLSHLGEGLRVIPSLGNTASAYNVTSFFLDKNLFGLVLILGAFHHFYLMEKGDPNKPVQVFLYTASLLVLMSILLVDSRLVMGVFFLCFLPLLFLSLKLDGKEPALERLAWITGITLSLGIVWINLPQIQLHKMAAALSLSHGFLPWTWKAAWHTFLDSPVIGCGIGGFRYSVVPLEGVWPARAGEMLPILFHANNHFLESMAEGGLIGFGLELLLILGAVFAFGYVYFHEWRLEAKYALISSIALLMMAQFGPFLELAPARFVLWALVGYGWSLFAEIFPRTEPNAPLSKTALAMAGSALMTLACLHLFLRIPDLRADRLFAKALTLSETNTKGFTDLVVESLRLNPSNEEANYGYVGILTEFHRETDAVKWTKQVQSFAPDIRKQSDILARIYSSLYRYDSAAKYASAVLVSSPRFLPALEILSEALKRQGKCAALDSLLEFSADWSEFYPLPIHHDYTIQGMDSLFHSNQEVIFLQRWFGGKGLRKQFAERRLNEYNQQISNYNRVRGLKETRCDEPGVKPGDNEPAPIPIRPRHMYRGWG